ncbi:MAG TPA: HPr family phosphocarrier protein [Kiritimatiellia bacterium]|nr:HPr family phosphocarrier protein [Kiritimatiellia bacterium]
MIQITAVIQNEHGIHCRPSAVILKAIEDYQGIIELESEGATCNPRSMLGLLSLELTCGKTVVIRVSGPEELATAETMKSLLETHFDFPPRTDR